MWFKTYGSTGKRISVIGFGGMRFPKPQDIDASAELLVYAHSKGVNYFDTAPKYCLDKSEDIFGAAFKVMPKGTYYVSTKCAEPQGAEVRRSLERSLQRLGVPKIHFFHIWCVLSLDEWKERMTRGAVAEAIKAKQEGLIEHITVSSHLRGDELSQVLREGPFDGVTLGYNAINFPFRAEAIQSAGRMGMGVVTMNPLGGGLIPRNAARFSFLQGPEDPSVPAAALRFNVSHQAITCALVGFTSKQQIDEDVAAIEDFTPYSQERIDAVRAKVMASFEGLCTGCGYCMPCPNGLDIPKMMDAYNMKILGNGSTTPVVNRLKWHWDKSPRDAKLCTQCGQCEFRCTQHIHIGERMQEIATLEESKSPPT